MEAKTDKDEIGEDEVAQSTPIVARVPHSISGSTRAAINEIELQAAVTGMFRESRDRYYPKTTDDEIARDMRTLNNFATVNHVPGAAYRLRRTPEQLAMNIGEDIRLNRTSYKFPDAERQRVDQYHYSPLFLSKTWAQFYEDVDQALCEAGFSKEEIERMNDTEMRFPITDNQRNKDRFVRACMILYQKGYHWKDICA